MAGPDGFNNPFETGPNRNPTAIGSGRNKSGGEGGNNTNMPNNGVGRVDGHSPNSASELQPNKARGDPAAILMRKLPASTSKQTLRSMLMFSRECDGCEFVGSTPGDQPFATAIARFRTAEGAHQAKELLNGRPTDDGLELKVDIINLTPGGSFNNQWGSDGISTDGGIGGHRMGSRFGDTFQKMDRISPRSNDNSRGGSAVDAAADGVSPTFNPARLNAQSPIGHGLGGRGAERVSGLSMIQQDEADDETARLLNDPGSFLSPEHQQLLLQQGRRATAPTLPSGIAERFGNLTINPSVGGAANGFVSPPPSGSAMTSPRGFGTGNSLYSGNGPNVNGMQHFSRGSISNATSPTSRYPPGIHSPISNYGGRPGQFFPPVNPADQNPPCNTLYVGNLPLDTSEDELKALFSKQRGYKRLCFRTKQNGPMCFVEFEEIQWATRALNELYGTMLSNSVRGGIRLSFSKNPLGVRGPPQQSPVSPNPNMQAGTPGGSAGGMAYAAGGPIGTAFGTMSPSSFSTASGPPPGLPAPQGYQNSRTSSGGNGNGNTNGNGNGATNGVFGSGRDSRNGAFGAYYAGR